MFYAPKKDVEEYYLCPYGATIKQEPISKIYIKPSKHLNTPKGQEIHRKVYFVAVD